VVQDVGRTLDEEARRVQDEAIPVTVPWPLEPAAMGSWMASEMPGFGTAEGWPWPAGDAWEPQLVREGETEPVRLKRRTRFAVTVYLKPRPGGFDASGFSVTSLVPGTSVSASVVRDLPVARLVQVATIWLLLHQVSDKRASAPIVGAKVDADEEAEGIGSPDDVLKQDSRDYWQAWRDQEGIRPAEVSGKGTGRRYPPEHLREVAKVVLEAQRRRESTVAAVTEVFGIKQSAATNQIGRARLRGFLADVEDEEARQ
jgi:hypothetical protein